MDDHQMPPATCPVCQSKLDGATNATGRGKPTEGDASFCLYCGNVAFFDSDLRLRRPTEIEQRAIDADPRIAMMRTARNSVMKKASH